MIKFGPNSISSIYFGDERIAEVYVGRKKVWPYYPGEGVYFGKGDVPNIYWSSELSSATGTDILSSTNFNLKFFTFLDGRQFSYIPESALWSTTEPFAFSGQFTSLNGDFNQDVLVTGAYLSYYDNGWIISPLTGSLGGN